jgi:DNA-binding CsgD family transcriptional regulator
MYTANVFRAITYAVVALFVCIWVFALRRGDPDQLWALFSAVIFFGLLGFSSFSFINSAASVSFVQAARDSLMLFAWMFTSGIAYRQGLPPLIAFGIGNLLFMRTDLLAGIVGLVAPDFAFESGSGLAVALSFCMAAVLIVYTIVLLTTHPATAAGTDDTDGQKDATEAIEDVPPDPFEAYQLTPRETQVVELLLRGYTLPQIGEHFSISLNTARWYAKSIYRKLNIHSKAELIELAESKAGTGRQPKTA